MSSDPAAEMHRPRALLVASEVSRRGQLCASSALMGWLRFRPPLPTWTRQTRPPPDGVYCMYVLRRRGAWNKLSPNQRDGNQQKTTNWVMSDCCTVFAPSYRIRRVGRRMKEDDLVEYWPALRTLHEAGDVKITGL